MSIELKSINPPAATPAPDAINFLEMPQDVLLQILQRIWQPKDVANLNFVSKSLMLLNQSSIPAHQRSMYLSKIYHQGFLDPIVNPSKFDSYQKYVNAYSHCDLIDPVHSEITQRWEIEFKLKVVETGFPSSLSSVSSLSAFVNSGQIDAGVESCLHILRATAMRPVHRLEVLKIVASSIKTTQEITKKFYNLLPAEMQTELRRQIWIANGKSSVTPDGVDRGLFYGEYIIDNEINSLLVQTAIRMYLSKFGVDAPANP